MIHLVSRKDWAGFVAAHDNFMFDMDGVLWWGETLIPGAQDAVNELIRLGKNVVFVTNNSTKSRAEYVPKFAKLGFKNVSVDMIFGSSFAAVMYLDSIHYSKSAPIFLCGGEGLRDELAASGYTVIPPTADIKGDFTTAENMCKVPMVPDVGAVICGFDGTISYVKLSIAHCYLSTGPEKVHFIATNADVTYPSPDGRTFLGSGSLFAPLVSSTGRKPVIVGKPNKLMLDLIISSHNFDPARTCMVGDRLDTDVLFGKAGGCNTMLVLSGCTKEETATAAAKHLQPDYISPSIASLLTAP